MKKVFLSIGLAVIPFVFLFFGLNFNRAMYGGDPEYAYLLNGILINKGQYVGHIDNPGTTVQIYSAIVLRIKHLINGTKGSDLEKDVLIKPNEYLESERNILIVFNALFLFVMGIFMFYLSGNFIFALVLELTPFLSADLLNHAWTKSSPEPMLLLAVSFMIVSLLYYFFTDPIKNKKITIIFGMIAGFGLATKATFLPLVVIPLIVLPIKKQKIIYLLWTIPSFIFFTIPAIPIYPQMFGWFYKLLIHKGTYGHGGVGLVDFGQYFHDLLSIAKNNIHLIISICIYLIIIIYNMIKNKLKSSLHSMKSLRFLFAVGSSLFLGVLMVAKHYHTNHYLLPVNAIIGLFLIFVTIYITEVFNFKNLKKILPFFVLLLFTLGSISRVPILKYADWGYDITNVEYNKINARLDNEFKEYTKFYFYPVALNPYSALRWGNIYSRQKVLSDLEQLYPEGLFYNHDKGKFEFWEHELRPEEILKKYGTKLLINGMPLSQTEKDNIAINGIALDTLYKGRVQAIYKIDVDASPYFLGGEKPLYDITFDLDNVSTDGKNIITKDKSVDGAWLRTTEISHSGKYSLKLKPNDEYAFDYKLPYVSKKQKYKLSVYALGNLNKSYLVAASIFPNLFYITSGDGLKFTPGKWNLMTLEFIVPENIDANGIKVYFWKNNKNTIYLDDFELKKIE